MRYKLFFKVSLSIILFIAFIFFVIAKTAYSEELSAWYFLQRNQIGHYCIQSTAIDSFTEMAFKEKVAIKDSVLRDLWDSVKKKDIPVKKWDIFNVSSYSLIQNTKVALQVWRSAPWKTEVDFDMFCKYILPYRIADEVFKAGWRDTLYAKFHPMIEKETDMKKAFEMVHDTISKSFHQADIGIPYNLSVLDLNRIQQGSCIQRCIYEASVMRSLGIPVTIDNALEWANYSTSGHAWIVLMTKEGIYTIARNDSVVRKENPIDASEFELKKELEPNHSEYFDEVLKFKKTVSRVIRYTYERSEIDYKDHEADYKTVSRFQNPFYLDVSCEYFRTPNIVINATDDYSYLCIFETGKDWTPVCYTRSKNGKAIFHNMGDSVVYIYATFSDGRLVCKGQPFLFAGGKIKPLIANLSLRQTMRLNRKYPLTTQFLNYWIRVKDGYFTASNDSSFKDSTLLYYVKHTPFFKNDIMLYAHKCYRYFKYATYEGTKHNIAEFQFYSRGNQLKGTYSSINVEDVEKAFDGSTFTYSECRKPSSIIVDFGSPIDIDRIVYYTRNDDNFVSSGDVYELFYYDNGWHSMGKKTSKGHSLTYEDAPSGCLYVLRNRSRGREERIFTYDKGKQIWF